MSLICQDSRLPEKIDENLIISLENQYLTLWVLNPHTLTKRNVETTVHSPLYFITCSSLSHRIRESDPDLRYRFHPKWSKSAHHTLWELLSVHGRPGWWPTRYKEKVLLCSMGLGEILCWYGGSKPYLPLASPATLRESRLTMKPTLDNNREETSLTCWLYLLNTHYMRL